MPEGQIEDSQPPQEDQARQKGSSLSGAIVPIQVDSEIPRCNVSSEGSVAPKHAEQASYNTEQNWQPNVFATTEVEDEERGRYSNEVQQTPLTALDASSNVEDTQELALLTEISNQLATRSPGVHQSVCHPSNDVPVSQASHTRAVTDTKTNEATKDVLIDNGPSKVACVSTDQIMQSCTDESKEPKTESLQENINANTGITAVRSFTEQRQLVHIHTLKQLVANSVLLTNMAFKEADYQQAAKLYDDLNSTACFYTTALRLDSCLKLTGKSVSVLTTI